MAFTIDRTQTQYNDKFATHAAKVGILNGSGTYTTGGDLTVTPGLFGLGRIDYLDIEAIWNGTTGYIGKYNYANAQTGTPALQLINPTTGNELANATSLAGFSARFLVVGVP